MTWKMKPVLRAAIKVLVRVRSECEHCSEGWEACDEILGAIHIKTEQRSLEIAEELDDLPR